MVELIIGLVLNVFVLILFSEIDAIRCHLKDIKKALEDMKGKG